MEIFLHLNLTHIFLARKENTSKLILPSIESDSPASNTLHNSRPLDLPDEIRNKIWRIPRALGYAELLYTSHNQPNFQRHTTEDDREAHYEVETAIPRVNH